MLGQLIPCGGGDAIPLTRPKLLVGRRSSCDIKLDFQNVSSHHCELELRDGYWHIRDLGSSNGTFLNGTRLSAHRPYQIRDGDEIRLGQMVVRVYFQSAKK